MHLLAKETSMFNEIVVYDTNELYGAMGKYRCLQFADDALQGAIDLRELKRIVLVYQRAIIQLLEFNNPLFKHVFVIGHGIGTIAGHYPDRSFTIAEIDEKVVEMSRLYFHYKQDNVVIGDGREILSHQEPNTFDYIVLDAFTHKGTPLHLTALEFFEMARQKLSPQGALILNLMGKVKNDRLINAIHTTLRETFSYIAAFTQSAVDEVDIRNIIVMASNRPIDSRVPDMAGYYEIDLGIGHIIRD